MRKERSGRSNASREVIPRVRAEKEGAATQNPTGPGSPHGPPHPPLRLSPECLYGKYFCRCNSVPNFKKNVTLEAQLSKDGFEVCGS